MKKILSKFKKFNRTLLQKKIKFIGMTILETLIVVLLISGGVTALFVTGRFSTPNKPQSNTQPSGLDTSESTQSSTVSSEPEKSAPKKEPAPVTQSKPSVPKVDCSAEYYKNTKVFQEWWSYHQKQVQKYIDDINKNDNLTPEEKNEQIDRWARYFNDRVNELLATWKKYMREAGCGSTPLGFSPGYMPVSE